MILAGDIGGTKCNLALFEIRDGKLRRVAQHRFPSRDYSHLEEIVGDFVRQTAGTISGAGSEKITAAGFGVAGPVIENRVRGTNLPWVVDGGSLGRFLGLKHAVVLNDLEATAYSLELLQPSELCALDEAAAAPDANKALIAAGTGLGEAILFWNGGRHIVSATEGGHVDFAPRTKTEIELLKFLKKQYEQVSFEHVLSGRGFLSIHQFLDASVRHPSFSEPDADPAPEITRLALEGACAVCIQTLDMWTALYGAEAGNLALKCLARGGVYVAGGIALKILAKMKDGTFVRAFCNKSKLGILLEQIPIYVVLNEDAPLLGAAAQAAARAGT